MSFYKRVFLILLLFSIFSYGQQPRYKKKVDSLETVLFKQKLTTKDKVEVYSRLCGYLRFQDDVKHKRYLDSLVNIVSKNNLQEYKGTLARYKAGYYNSVSEFILAEKYYEEAINEFYKIGKIKQAHKNLRYLSKVQRRLGKLEDAMHSIMKVIKEKDSLGIEIELGKDYNRLGAIHGTLKNTSLSNSYFKKAESIYLKENKESSLAGIRQNMGINYAILKEYDVALSFFEKSIAYNEKANKYFSLTSLYNHVGNIKLRQDSLKIAKSYFDKALVLSVRYNYPVQVAKSNYNLGKTYFEQKKHIEALKYLKKSLSGYKAAKSRSNESHAYFMISKTYAALNDFSNAYHYRTLHFNVYDSIFKQESINKINELEIKYQTEKKEAEIALQNEEIKTLNTQAKNDKLTKTLYIIGMFSFIAVSGLIYFSFKQRIKKNKIEREKQEEIYKQEIEFKKKELASQTLHLVQKNTFIQELKENLEKIKQSPELFKIEYRRLVMLLKKESAEDKDWEVFKSYFSEVHNNFDHKLKAIYNDINEKEIRLASFLRMNLSTKEIASMTNVLPESVLKSKYRLKKKLNLDKDTDLNDFLNSL